MGIKFLTLLSVFSCALGATVFSDDIDTKLAESPIFIASSPSKVKNTEDLSDLSSAEALDLLHKIAMNMTTPNPKPAVGDQTELPVNPDDNETVEEVKPSGPVNPNESGKIRCQDTSTMLFIETARSCKDERGPAICEKLFDAPDEKTGKRDARCDQPGFEDIAKSCRNRCAICCEDLNYSCENDNSGLVDCKTNVVKCEDPKFFGTLSKYCAGTCGLCQKTSCRDRHPDCRTMKAICLNPQHQETMKLQCSRTCGFCQVEGSNPISVPSPESSITPPAPLTIDNCVDIAKNCAGRANLCKHPVYSDYMSKYCRKTCGQCGMPVGDSTCADSNPRCPAWVTKGFCSNNYYTAEYRKINCAKSCGLC
ncbi:hypothetical protein FO519_006946 [Halicephalobus sp. NKZ332]|nr:hypothetical protein FO519_006946 [Halicephalobus sp. NKZ332]